MESPSSISSTRSSCSQRTSSTRSATKLHSLISDHGYSKIVLDFRHVQYIASMMLAKLAKLERHVEIAHGKLRLCGLGPILKDTFRIGHFERVFDIHDDARAAIDSPW